MPFFDTLLARLETCWRVHSMMVACASVRFLDEMDLMDIMDGTDIKDLGGHDYEQEHEKTIYRAINCAIARLREVR